MAKTQMRLANRAWRTETRSRGWDRGWKGGRKAWKKFCRENAAWMVADAIANHDDIADQRDANGRVAEELTYWGD